MADISCGAAGAATITADVPIVDMRDASFPATSLASGVWTKLGLDTVETLRTEDATNRIPADTANSRMTATEDGIYSGMAVSRLNNVGNATPNWDMILVELEVRVNGVGRRRFVTTRYDDWDLMGQDVASQFVSVGWFTLYLRSGDEIELWQRQVNEAGLTCTGSLAPQYRHLTLAKIGERKTGPGPDISCTGGDDSVNSAMQVSVVQNLGSDASSLRRINDTIGTWTDIIDEGGDATGTAIAGWGLQAQASRFWVQAPGKVGVEICRMSMNFSSGANYKVFEAGGKGTKTTTGSTQMGQRRRLAGDPGNTGIVPGYGAISGGCWHHGPSVADDRTELVGRWFVPGGTTAGGFDGAIGSILFIETA